MASPSPPAPACPICLLVSPCLFVLLGPLRRQKWQDLGSQMFKLSIDVKISKGYLSFTLSSLFNLPTAQELSAL